MKHILGAAALALCIGAFTPCVAQAATFSEGIVSEAGFRQIHMAPTETTQLAAPALTHKSVWFSSAPSVASVDASGRVTARASGTAVIYAANSDSSSIYEHWIIEVDGNAQPGSLELDLRVTALQTGTSTTLKAKATGDAAGAIRWRSSDPAVVTVTNGVLKARASGSAMIYAESENGRYTASCMVYVLNNTLSLPLGESTLPAGKTLYNYKKSLLPLELIWTTSDASVAVVREGFIEAVGEGTAMIAAVTKYGAAAYCTVTVTAPEPITAAYLDSNNPKAGVGTELVLITNPLYNQFTVTLKDAAGTAIRTLQISAENATCTPKESDGRKVNIWRVPVTFDAAGNHTVDCGSYSFDTYVSPALDTTKDTSRQYVTTAALNLRAAPGIESELFLTIPYSTLLTVEELVTTDPTMHWGKVTYNGIVGYVCMDYMSRCEGELRNWYASTELLQFLTRYEGFSSSVYYDVVNVPTIGYGQALFERDTFYNYQTPEESWAFLCNQVNMTYGKATSDFMLKNKIRLTQSQFDALTSFTYNMGQYCWTYYSFQLKTLLLNNPNASAINPTALRYAFGKQSRAGGTFWLGLFRRRMDEWQMFTTGDYTELRVDQLTGDLRVPTLSEQNDPNKYKSDWTYVGYH